MEQQKIWDYYQNEGLELNAFNDSRQRFILRFLKPPQVVLNIGVGNGALERMGIEKGINMYTLDPSHRAIERLRLSLGMGECAQVGRAESMPFKNEQFDAVVMSEVLEHLSDKKINSALKNIQKILKPKGSLIISTPYRENLKLNIAVCPDCGKVFHKFGHTQSFNKEKIRSVLVRNRFKVEKLFLTSFVDWRRKGLRNLVKSFLRVFLARLGEGVADPHLVVIAHKNL